MRAAACVRLCSRLDERRVAWRVRAASYTDLSSFAPANVPIMVNDVTRQWTLLDRRLVYRTLKENNIPGRTAVLQF